MGKKVHCYEFLLCEKQDCIMFRKGDDCDTPCWETEGTLCFDDRIRSHISGGMDKSFFCNSCLYRLHMQDKGIPKFSEERPTISR